MVIGGTKLYILMMMFALCSMLGLGVEQLLWRAAGNKGRRGLMREPFGVMYGIAGFLALMVRANVGSFILSLLILLVLCLGLSYGMPLLTRFLSGVEIWSFSRPSVIGAVVGAFELSLTAKLIARGLGALPAMLSMVLLIAYYSAFVYTGVDAFSLLHSLKKITANKKTLTDDQRKIIIKPYVRWIQAYPNVKKALKQALWV
ncbi:MAG: hypothetical protein PUB39_00790 [Eubacteriales bacterium]|nr:hypothetical protein [Eubacteriales bacterium]